MIEKDFFLLDRLKDFVLLDFPIHITEQDYLIIRKMLFSRDSFLSYRLIDREFIMSSIDEDRNRLFRSFLLYLFNCEIDILRDESMVLHYDGQSGPPNMILTMAAIEISYYHLVDRQLIRSYFKRINTIFEVGYERCFFDLFDELVYNVCVYKDYLMTDVLGWYGKTLDTIIENDNVFPTDANLLKCAMLQLYIESYSPSPTMQLRLLLKLFKSKIVIDSDLRYNGLVQDGVVYIKANLGFSVAQYKTLLMHEACHILMKYEDRYGHFMSICDGVDQSLLLESWCVAKERCVDFKVNMFCNYNRSIESLGLKNNTGIIMNDSIMYLKKKIRKDSFTWT